MSQCLSLLIILLYYYCCAVLGEDDVTAIPDGTVETATDGITEACASLEVESCPSKKSSSNLFIKDTASSNNDDHCTEKLNDTDEEASLSTSRKIVQQCFQQHNQQQLHAIVNCIQHQVTKQLLQQQRQLQEEETVRVAMSDKLEYYSCRDTTLETSKSLYETTWHEPEDSPNDQQTSTSRNNTIPVSVLLERPTARIHILHNFISTEECQAMAHTTKNRHRPAEVANGQGGFHVDPVRQAKHAKVTIPWFGHYRPKSHKYFIQQVGHRLYQYLHHVHPSLKQSVTHYGQETMASILYQGQPQRDKHNNQDSRRGFPTSRRPPTSSNMTTKQDESPDQYLAHCDGNCDGGSFKEGARMATFILYCEVPEVGGHTNFGQADLHVKPETGMAVFFSYVDPLTNQTDHGWTQHSGCPVLTGVKRIITQWIRYGVDKQTPHTTFNSLDQNTRELKLWY